MKSLRELRDLKNKNHFYKRIVMTIGGILLCGVGVGFLKLSAFGVDPFQSFMAGLSAIIPFSFGTLHILVSVCLLMFMLVFDRHYIGSGTIYDAVALILANKWHVGQFRYARLGTDLICVSLGCTLYVVSGGSLTSLTAIAGIGTMVTAFFMGSLIEFFNQTLAQPFLNGEHKGNRVSRPRKMSIYL